MCGKTSWGTMVLGVCLALWPAQAPAQQYAPADPQVPIPYGSTRPEDGGPYTFGMFGMYRQTNPLRAQLVAVRGLFAYDTGGRTVTRQVQRFLPSVDPNGDGIFTLQPLNPFIDQPDFSHDTGPLPAGSLIGATITGGIETAFNNGIGAFPATQLIGQFILREETQVIAGLFNQPGFVGSAQAALNTSQLHQRNSYEPSVQLGVGWKFKDGSSVNLSWLYVSEAQYRAGASLAPQVGPGVLADNVLGPR